LKPHWGGSQEVFPEHASVQCAEQFDSSNDLKDDVGKWTGSCQWSSAIWCLYAIHGYMSVDPRKHNEEALRKLVKDKSWGAGTGPSLRATERMKEMAEDLGMTALPVTTTKTLYKEQAKELIATVWDGEQATYLVWMNSHMIAFHRHGYGGESAYFYDNDMGCVRCASKVMLEKLALWSCRCTGELGESLWTAAKCSVTVGNKQLRTLVREVNGLAGVHRILECV